MTTPGSSDRQRLRAIAFASMRARGLEPEFPSDALAEAASLTAPARTTEEPLRDLRDRLWCSIDNDDSRDLDQLSVAEPLAAGAVKILVAVADVDATVRRSSPIDRHAAVNTTSIYTPGVIFPMLPEKLSTDLTSLAEHGDRLAVIFEFTVAPDGTIDGSDVYGALVRNQAKLAYNAVDAWLTDRGALPPAAGAAAGMAEQLRMQDRVAQSLGRRRHEHGALHLETVEVQSLFEGDTLLEQRPDLPNRAKAIIENLMIAANGTCVRFLTARGFPSLRRIVKDPARWDRIVALAAQTGDRLPDAPDARALSGYLDERRRVAPSLFVDLSQTIIKLIGRGEYVVEGSRGGSTGGSTGHFGLAVHDYTHSTAPNRRYPDLVTQRLVKAALAGHPVPYADGDLEALASHCTQQEDQANKVERQVRKSAAALLMASRVGSRYDAVVTGAASKGTYVRIVAPPVEGRVVQGASGLDVGDRLQVRLVHVDVERGYIDFAAAPGRPALETARAGTPATPHAAPRGGG